jgi:N-acetylglucosamine kinase-like BadF-type ATPase
MKIAAGVDAGGTSTVVAVSRDGGDETTASGGPGNAATVGVQAATEAIVATVRRATAGDDPAALYVGAAGAGREAIARALEDALRRAFPATSRLVVHSDVEAAFRAAIPEGPGIVVIAGTGSVAYGENGSLRAVVGGYGYLAGDEGSAFAIGFGALKLLSRVYDGRAHEDETSALAARALGCADRDGVLAVLSSLAAAVPKIAALAPSIIAFAGKGNRASAALVQTAADELAGLVAAATMHVKLGDAMPKVALAGGLLRDDSLLTTLLAGQVSNAVRGATIVRLRDEPARAALRLAEKLLA